MIRKFYYGDIPESGSGTESDSVSQKSGQALKSPSGDQGNVPGEKQAGIDPQEWPLWEVFIRSRQGLDHKHVGSLHAADAAMAIENARDVYTRRMEGVSIWVVESRFVHASNPDEADMLYEPANDKIYRHPTFYDLPDELSHM
jgi:ring-1,2-phenylacetyl-CoA epoxidase subunit PaaB